MATIASAQSGNWHVTTTWVGGIVPNLSSDDVIIATDHEVIIEAGEYISMGGGNMLAVVEGATLRVQGGLDIGSSTLWVDGTVVSEGVYLATWNGTEVLVQTTGTLEVAADFYLESVATATIEGQFIVASGGYADICDGGLLTLEVGAIWQDYGYCCVERYSQALIRDDFSVEDGGHLVLFEDGMIDIASAGAVFVTGTLAVSLYSRIEVFGYFGLHQDGLLNINSNSLIHVYKDIHISGRMTGGGRIVMLRREGRILDYDGDSLFALDRAYGYGRMLIT